MTASFQFVGESNDIDGIGFDILVKRTLKASGG
jgi:hypothetical protein